jgi:hypothetical protein
MSHRTGSDRRPGQPIRAESVALASAQRAMRRDLSAVLQQPDQSEPCQPQLAL